jgi:hypothetical protein
MVSIFYQYVLGTKIRVVGPKKSLYQLHNSRGWNLVPSLVPVDIPGGRSELHMLHSRMLSYFANTTCPPASDNANPILT